MTLTSQLYYKIAQGERARVLYSQSRDALLLTGGTGSFGQAFAAHLLSLPDGPRVRIYSRDEDKQERMAEQLPSNDRLTYILGDVRDTARVAQAVDGCRYIVHAAALKRVPVGEQQASEFSETNVTGTQNVIRAALACNVKRTLFISSDKAVAPVNHYGKTKSTAEGMIIQGNALGVSRGCLFGVVRGGNVWGSRGSVVEKWAAADEITVTGPLDENDEPSTRFYMRMDYWTEFCFRVLTEMHGGEIFVPKLRAWALRDVASAFDKPTTVLQARAGDKAHEEMIAPVEVGRTLDIGWGYVIQPSEELRAVWNYRAWAGKRLSPSFVYTSKTAERMTVDELRRLVNE